MGQRIAALKKIRLSLFCLIAAGFGVKAALLDLSSVATYFYAYTDSTATVADTPPVELYDIAIVSPYWSLTT